MDMNKIREITNTVKKKQEAAREEVRENKLEILLKQQQIEAESLIERIPHNISASASNGNDQCTLIDHFYGQMKNGELVGGCLFKQLVLDWCKAENITVKVKWYSNYGEDGWSYLCADWGNRHLEADN